MIQTNRVELHKSVEIAASGEDVWALLTGIFAGFKAYFSSAAFPPRER
jgi:hypothetical protein